MCRCVVVSMCRCVDVLEHDLIREDSHPSSGDADEGIVDSFSGVFVGACLECRSSQQRVMQRAVRCGRRKRAARVDT